MSNLPLALAMADCFHLLSVAQTEKEKKQNIFKTIMEVNIYLDIDIDIDGSWVMENSKCHHGK